MIKNSVKFWQKKIKGYTSIPVAKDNVIYLGDSHYGQRKTRRKFEVNR